MGHPANDISELEIIIAKKRFNRNKLIDAFRGTKLPTQKQFLFVKYLFLNYGKIESYHKAGYKHNGKPALNWMQAEKVYKSDKVQILIGLILEDYVHAQRITATGLINEALKTYDRAETAKEQLETLKFIAKIAGY
jgi:hypothetical protein